MKFWAAAKKLKQFRAPAGITFESEAAKVRCRLWLHLRRRRRWGSGGSSSLP